MGRPLEAGSGDADPTLALAEFVASVEHLPLFTGVAAQLIKSVDREDVTAGELSKLISTDAALVAQLLRLVNSPFYGLRRSIGTVSDAIAVLGLNLIRRIVIAAVLQRPLFAYLHDTRAARDFWRHQLLCATIARQLHAQKGLNGELAYMAGLLHDVGRLVMLVKYPNDIDMLLEDRSIDDDSAIERERQRFGFDHAVVGAALLEIWDLPGPMVFAAGQHADETEPDDAMAASIWHANLLAHTISDVPDEDVEDSLVLSLGLTEVVRRKILEEVSAFENMSG